MKLNVMMALLMVLTACSTLPPSINDAPQPDIQLQQHLITDAIGKQVRWGGRIIEVDNDEEDTRIQVLAFPLNSFGRPDSNQDSLGRFMIYSKGFLDPEVYKVDRYITVFGTILQQHTIQVGKKNLALPMVEMNEHHIWKQERYYDDDFHSPYWLRPHYYYQNYYW